jgi:hypothetical protein
MTTPLTSNDVLSTIEASLEVAETTEDITVVLAQLKAIEEAFATFRADMLAASRWKMMASRKRTQAIEQRVATLAALLRRRADALRAQIVEETPARASAHRAYAQQVAQANKPPVTPLQSPKAAYVAPPAVRGLPLNLQTAEEACSNVAVRSVRPTVVPTKKE